MLKLYWPPLFIISFVFLSGVLGCKHEPFQSEDSVIPIDTTGNNPVDTTSSKEECDPNVVYFQQQVLPLLKSNCAISGCHNAGTAAEGIILDTYINVLTTGKITPEKPLNSDIYEVLVEDKEAKRMPPAPRSRLNADQIKLIGDWILQGAQDLQCDPNPGGVCSTSDVSYAMTVAPVISSFCLGCHSGTAPSGGVSLSSHANVKTVAQNGRLIGAIKWQPGYAQMPQGSAKLSQCTIDQISAWVSAGAPDN